MLTILQYVWKNSRAIYIGHHPTGLNHDSWDMMLFFIEH